MQELVTPKRKDSTYFLINSGELDGADVWFYGKADMSLSLEQETVVTDDIGEFVENLGEPQTDIHLDVAHPCLINENSRKRIKRKIAQDCTLQELLVLINRKLKKELQCSNTNSEKP